jgi:hypothetical protein
MQDLHAWFRPWHYLKDSVMWVQMDTGRKSEISSLELFDG